MKEILKEQVNKLPISRLVFPSTPAIDHVQKDESRFISIDTFRTKSYFPNPFYKNISREIPLSINEDH